MTAQVEVLTGEQYEVEDSSGIVDLIEAIRIQSTGPTEASRALRKKLLVTSPNPIPPIAIVPFLTLIQGNMETCTAN